MNHLKSMIAFLSLSLVIVLASSCDSDDPIYKERDVLVSRASFDASQQGDDAQKDPESEGDEAGNPEGSENPEDSENSEDQGDTSDTGMEQDQGAEGEETIADEDSEGGPTEVVQNISGLGAFQVKSVDVLKSSIVTCFNNPDILSISEDMLIDDEAPAELGNGRERFLIPKGGSYVAGANIVDLERENLSGDAGPVTGVRSDQLTDTYLRAVSVVADVVAHNCSANDPYCTCGSEQSATEMLARCLPSFSPNSDAFKSLAVQFAGHCGSTEKSQREAIASLIASYAFIKGR